MSDPDDIRRDIERTRAELSDNVNALADSANPGNIARSKVDEVKEKAVNLKERVFGDPDNPFDDGVVGDARDRAAEAVGGAKGAVTDLPTTARMKTRGNPLAAGLVAAGLGALVGSLLPSTQFERRSSQRIKDAAAPLAEEAKGLAQDAAQHLQPTAQDAAQSLKDSATAAGQRVADTAAAAKDDVAAQATDAAQTVKSEAGSTASGMTGSGTGTSGMTGSGTTPSSTSGYPTTDPRI
ncbi:MAG TPA: hypothetical protein DEG88_02095 [Propionibacteriaceae bacterium]|nr:hypothetical protein [Propionibacteriaceae bacterium]HBY22120.1 hypothetical protein [Propionibacteriaceae bacterium]